MSDTTIGNLDQEVIVKQVTHTLAIQRVKPENLLDYEEEDWTRLFARSFGAGYAKVRLAILLAAVEDQKLQKERTAKHEKTWTAASETWPATGM